MKFDTIILGGGLAGQVCGIRLAEAGRRCAIISQGQSALHFWSGSFDLLNNLPGGERVESPVEAIEELVRTTPEHPYARIGAERFGVLAERGCELLRKAGVRLVGSPERNHYRITPMGVMRPTWLTLADYAHTTSDKTLPWQKVLLYNIEGFLDFYPRFIADEFRALGVECEQRLFNTPDLAALRRNPTEMRSVNIARVFDRDASFEALIADIENRCAAYDAVLLPAVIGLGRGDCADDIERAVGKPVRMLSPLHLSVPGLRVQQQLNQHFRALGGLVLPGDTALRGQLNEGRVESVSTANHGQMALRADDFVLATGSYFSNGLVATPDAVHEPVFGLDVEFAPDRSHWYGQNFFDPQPFHTFGIRTGKGFTALRAGEPITNLRVVGAGLGGFNALKEGCGAGVSILSALEAADHILNSKS